MKRNMNTYNANHIILSTVSSKPECVVSESLLKMLRNRCGWPENRGSVLASMKEENQKIVNEITRVDHISIKEKSFSPFKSDPVGVVSHHARWARKVLTIALYTLHILLPKSLEGLHEFGTLQGV